MKKFFYLLLLSCFTTHSVFASDEIIHLWRSMRSVGMGSTFVTTGNYSDALFGNPARHTEVSESKTSIIDLNLEANANLISNINTISDIKGSGAAIISSIAPLAGKNQHGRLGLLIAGYSPEFFNDNFGFAGGFLINLQANVYPHMDTTVDSQTYIDIGPHFGVSHKFLENHLSVGANAHIGYRLASDTALTAIDFLNNNSTLNFKSLGKEGIGADLDLGAFYHIPWEPSWIRLSTGLSISNLLQSHYNLLQPALIVKDNSMHPPRNNRTLNLGIRADFPDAWIFHDNVFALELTDIGSVPQRVTTPKRFHLGAETKFLPWFSFRFGVNQGYATAGLGFDWSIFKMDVATWGEELGSMAGQQEDRRFGLRLAAEL